MTVVVTEHDQRLANLRRANEIRVYRATLRRNMTADLCVAILTDPPADTLTMPVRALLQAVPLFGPVKARRLLLTLSIAQDKRLGELTERQRLALAEAIA